MPHVSTVGSPWQGSLRDLAQMVQHIRNIRAFGRLSLRNTERLGIAHLYFRAGKLVHIVGNHGDVQVILQDMGEWKRAVLRFERSVTINEVTLGEEHEKLLDETIMNLYRRGLVAAPQAPRVIDGSAVTSSDVKQLITPWEWQVLIEGTRRISLAVAHLVGPREALQVLQDILDDCSAAFPAFASLKIASGGYLQVADRSQLDHMSREEVLEGFTALFATCQYFCAPIIGDNEAHKLIIQALRDIGPTLSNLGVFQIDNHLLTAPKVSKKQ